MRGQTHGEQFRHHRGTRFGYAVFRPFNRRHRSTDRRDKGDRPVMITGARQHPPRHILRQKERAAQVYIHHEIIIGGQDIQHITAQFGRNARV